MFDLFSDQLLDIKINQPVFDYIVINNDSAVTEVIIIKSIIVRFIFRCQLCSSYIFSFESLFCCNNQIQCYDLCAPDPRLDVFIITGDLSLLLIQQRSQNLHTNYIWTCQSPASQRDNLIITLTEKAFGIQGNDNSCTEFYRRRNSNYTKEFFKMDVKSFSFAFMSY